MKHIKLFLMAVLVFLFFVSVVVADAGTELALSGSSEDEIVAISSSTSLKVNQIRQDPFPVAPGQVVDLYFNINNAGGPVQSPKFELILGYPFTLDPASEAFDKFAYIGSGEKVSFNQKLRVDNNAASGEYEIEFRSYFGNNYYPSFFKINIDDVTTGFDLAIQEISEDGMSLAISNIGKNDAKSITVRLEDQENFELLGFSSYILGNLNSGDYTIVNVVVQPKDAEFGETIGLELFIDYTDVVGGRRTITKTIPLKITQQAQKGFDSLSSSVFGLGEESGGSSGFFIFTTVLLIVALIIVVIRYRKKIKKHLE